MKKNVSVDNVEINVEFVTKKAEVIQVIRTNIATRGDGTTKSPTRFVTQYWTLDGELLFEEEAE